MPRHDALGDETGLLQTDNVIRQFFTESHMENGKMVPAHELVTARSETIGTGDFSRVRPTAPFPVGLLYYIIECQSIIGAGKKDLLGFSQMDGLRANAGSERVEK